MKFIKRILKSLFWIQSGMTCHPSAKVTSVISDFLTLVFTMRYSTYIQGSHWASVAIETTRCLPSKGKGLEQEGSDQEVAHERLLRNERLPIFSSEWPLKHQLRIYKSKAIKLQLFAGERARCRLPSSSPFNITTGHLSLSSPPTTAANSRLKTEEKPMTTQPHSPKGKLRQEQGLEPFPVSLW